MTLKIFEVFFHMNPTFAAPLFRKYCKEWIGDFEQELFAEAVLRYFREGIEGRLNFLFCLYDLDGSQGISFS
jgi:hypothetical protein